MLGAKIAIYVPSMDGGGAERTALAIGKALDAQGYVVDLVVANARGALLDDPFVQTRLIPLGRRDPLLAILAYIRYLRREKPDLVISLVHSANMVSGIGAWLSSHSRTIVSVHNTLLKPPRLQWWFRRMLGLRPERLLYRRVTFVQTVSQELADQCHQLLGIGGERLVVTYNSAGTSTTGTTVRPLVDDRPYLLSAGRLVPIKGFDVVLRAFARAAIDSRWMLAIVGDGPERTRLTALAGNLGISDRVVFAGYQSPVTPWFQHASGFVFATRGEGFGLVVHEALIANLPIVASRTSGVSEVLANGILGRLVEVDDETAFATGIEDIVDGRLPPPPPETLREQLALFDPDAVDQRYVEMIERALKMPAGFGR